MAWLGMMEVGTCPPLALTRLTNAAAQLPYGSGETKGKGRSLHFVDPTHQMVIDRPPGLRRACRRIRFNRRRTPPAREREHLGRHCGSDPQECGAAHWGGRASATACAALRIHAGLAPPSITSVGTVTEATRSVGNALLSPIMVMS